MVGQGTNLNRSQSRSVHLDDGREDRNLAGVLLGVGLDGNGDEAVFDRHGIDTRSMSSHGQGKQLG